MRDSYTTVRRSAQSEIKVQASRFIARVEPVRDPGEAREALASLRKEYFDATHHASAYRLGVDGAEARAQDDGEPSGTAGRPILAALERAGLTDVMVVVIRYFGGTKLGTGGLARAYGEAAAAALREAELVERFVTGAIRASFPHAQVSNVMRSVARLGARVVETSYDEEVHLQLEIRLSKLEELTRALTENTSGNIRMSPLVPKGGAPEAPPSG
jgi:uncharacterized YigZ family protein